jgi:hypothetical protein
MAKIAKKSVVCDGVTGQVVFDWADGQKEGYGLNDLSEEMVVRLAIHGLAQKLGDSYAGAKSVKEAQDNVAYLFAALASGDWTIKGERTSTGGIWAEALAAVTGQPIEACAAKLAEMDEAQLKVIKANPQMKAAKAKIDLERAEKKAKLAEGETEGLDLSDLF